MSKVALGLALGLLLLFTYLTGVKAAYAFAYALCLLFLVSWAWPRIAIRGMRVTRHLDPGTPTVGEPKVRKSGGMGQVKPGETPGIAVALACASDEWDFGFGD